ncbi:hypothetical protein [Pseudonocardia ailaonensis]
MSRPRVAGPKDRRALVRGAALASLITLLTALGHVVGGGTLPDLGLLLVLFPLLAVALTTAAERARGPVGMLLVLGAGQLVMHELLLFLGHDHAAQGTGPGMVAAHGVATLVSGLFLRDADRMISALAGALRRILPRRAVPMPARRPLHTFVAAPAGVALLVARSATAAVVRRGPPLPDPIPR